MLCQVDDDDRDFRRSKKHDPEAVGGGVVIKKITAPITTSVLGGGSGRVVSLSGKKRNFNSLPDAGPTSNRCVFVFVYCSFSEVYFDL